MAEGDKIDLRGLLTDVGFVPNDISLFLALDLDEPDGQAVLRVDATGTGNMAAADMSIRFANSTHGLTSLESLIEQQVLLLS